MTLGYQRCANLQERLLSIRNIDSGVGPNYPLFPS